MTIETMNEENKDQFYTFGDKEVEPQHVSKFVNTSGLNLPNERETTINGEIVKTGYLSHSALNTYKMCQKAYEWKYVLKEPSKPKVAILMGSNVHKVLETALRYKMKHKTLMDFVDLKDMITDQWTDEIDKIGGVSSLDWGEKGSLEASIKMGQDIVNVLYHEAYQKLNPIGVEEIFVYKIPVNGGELPLMGFVDIIDLVGNDKVVLDFKTGARLKTEDDLETDSQLTLYSMSLGIPRVGFLSAASTKVPKIARLETTKTAFDHQALQEDFAHMANGISQGIFARTGRGTWMCSKTSCDYYTKCVGKNS